MQKHAASNDMLELHYRSVMIRNIEQRYAFRSIGREAPGCTFP